MKRNLTLGLSGLATIAIATAALLRPSVAQTVDTTEPFGAVSPAPAEQSANQPAAAAAAPSSDLARSAAPVAGELSARFAPDAVPTAEGSDPFGAAAKRGNDRFLYGHLPQGHHPPLQELAAAVRGAKDDAARAAATELMQKTLNETFDADMKRREQELTKLEERLKVLRQQMTRRQAKKGEIIELQSRVLLNEADGLGFYSSDEAIYARPASTSLWNTDAFAPGAAPPAVGGMPVAPAAMVPVATPPAGGGL